MNKIRFINPCGAGAKMFQEKEVNAMDFMLWFHAGGGGGMMFKKHLWALKSKFSPVNKLFQLMDNIFCVEFQRYPLKFHTKCIIH